MKRTHPLAYLALLVVIASGCAWLFGQQCTGDPAKWSCSCNGSQDPSCPAPLDDNGDNPSDMAKKTTHDGGTPR